MHDRLFQSAETHSWSAGDRTDFETFSVYASDMKLDVAALQTCVTTNRHAGRIADNMRAASALGIRSTPTFLVNGKLLVGAQPFRVWQHVLDQLLGTRKEYSSRFDGVRNA